MRPGLVIGRGGETIRALATVLEEKFQLPSPQISVAEIEIPELNAYVVASKIASALKRGVHYRRAGFWGITQAMEAGALGIEIIISGKLRTDRARYEKFSEGYLPKSGEPPRKYMRKAELHVQLKPGTLGVKVRLLPPDAQFPDKVQVYTPPEEFEPEPEKEIVEETPITVEKVVEPEVTVAEETIEAPVPPAEEKAVTEKEAEQAMVPTENLQVEEPKIPKKRGSAEEKVPEKVTEAKTAPKKKTAEAEATPVKEEKVPEIEPSQAEKEKEAGE